MRESERCVEEKKKKSTNNTSSCSKVAAGKEKGGVFKRNRPASGRKKFVCVANQAC
jgi:hypothetical protein